MSKDWWKEKAKGVPHIITETPGPNSKKINENTCKYLSGLSTQAKLFPVAFEEGSGITMTDVDGNR